MAVSLAKGQKVDLTKTNPGLKEVLIGLGWDTNKYDGGSEFDFALERQQRIGQFRAVNRSERVENISVAGRGECDAGAVKKSERNFGTTERKFRNEFMNAICFGRSGF